jgi:hypothetical protein
LNANYFNFYLETVFGRRGWGAISPNAARRKHVPKRSIQRCLENVLGDATGDALSQPICLDLAFDYSVCFIFTQELPLARYELCVSAANLSTKISELLIF